MASISKEDLIDETVDSLERKLIQFVRIWESTQSESKNFALPESGIKAFKANYYKDNDKILLSN